MLKYKTIHIDKVLHVYPHTVPDIDPFLGRVCEAMDLTVPMEYVRDEAHIREAVIRKLRQQRQKSIEDSWRLNPEPGGH